LVTEVSFQEPRGISVTAQGNFFVCDSGNQCVQFISPNGSILKTVGKGELCKPFDCLCYEDNVFVSDREAHLIKVYSNSDGRFLYKFGRYGTVDVELNGPSGLAMDKAGYLLVCSGYLLNSPHRIHVYTVTSAASVDDHNKSSSQITVYYYTQRLLYSARSAHQKPPLQRVSSFFTWCCVYTTLVSRDKTVLQNYVNYF